MVRRTIFYEGDSAVVTTSPAPAVDASEEGDVDIVSLAAVVRAVYCNCVRTIAFGPITYGDRLVDGDNRFSDRKPGRNGWERLAIHLLAIAATPDAYITAQFQRYAVDRSGGPSFPPIRMLYSEWAVRNWCAYKEQRAAAIKRQIASDNVQINLLSVPLRAALQWGEAEAVRYAITADAECKITPLTRLVVADRYGFSDLVNSVFSAALSQYVFEMSLYDSVLAVPQRLVAAARRIRQDVGLIS